MLYMCCSKWNYFRMSIGYLFMTCSSFFISHTWPVFWSIIKFKKLSSKRMWIWLSASPKWEADYRYVKHQAKWAVFFVCLYNSIKLKRTSIDLPFRTKIALCCLPIHCLKNVIYLINIVGRERHKNFYSDCDIKRENPRACVFLFLFLICI